MSRTPKTTEATEDRKPMVEPDGGWPPDEFSGKAGQYVRDPYTGIRRPAEPEPTDEQPAG